MTNATPTITSGVAPAAVRFSWPTRVLTGPGGVEALGAHAAGFGSRALIVTDAGVRQAGLVAPVEESLEAAGVASAIYDDVASDPSIQAVEGAVALIEDQAADIVVAVGGGSSIDAAKAAAVVASRGGSIRDYEGFDRVLGPTMPLIAVPTTVGTGSEVTRGAVISDKESHRKMVIVDDGLYPRLAVLDPRCVAQLPGPIAAATGMDALAHAVEGYTTTGATPLSDALCLAAVRMVGRYLRPAVAGDPEALYQMLQASCLAGAGFHNVGLGLAHALSSVVGGHYPVHHGVATGLFLPHVMRFNLIASTARFADIAEALGEVRGERSERAFAALAPEAVVQLMEDLGVPTTLREVNVPESAFAQIAEEALDQIDRPGNPRRNTRDDLVALCREAF
jgi:alcohol dehydrogenase class IV